MVVNNFDLLAPFYDRIARLVFGDQLLKAQIQFLNHVRSEDEILILGGGTGELLEYLPECRAIHFVEKSERMISLASNRTSKTKIDLINADYLTVDTIFQYDLVICPFFLDCFSEQQLKRVLIKIKSMLKSKGHILVTDFRSTKSNWLTLKMMHVFFKAFAMLEAQSLLDIDHFVKSAGFELIKEKFSHRNQLFSRLYRNL